VLVVRWIPLIGFIAPMGLWLMPLTVMGRDLEGRGDAEGYYPGLRWSDLL
jgi:hypothetical protein